MRKQILAAITAAVAAACGGGGPTSPNGTPSPGQAVTAILLTNSGTFQVGTDTQLQATAVHEDGSKTVVTSEATWASITPDVATVTPGGKARGIKPGAAVIRASLGGQTGEIRIVVLGRPVAVTVRVLAFVCLADCDATLNGDGDFTYSVEVRASGSDPGDDLYQTPGYPSSGGQIKLGDGEQHSIDKARTFKLRDQPGEGVALDFESTEWDTLSPDSRLDYAHAFVSFPWTEASGWGSAPGTHSITLGSGSCRVRLDFNISLVY